MKKMDLYLLGRQIL